MNSSGIYQIRNIVNNHIYIGSAKNFKTRWNTHLCNLRKGKHHSSHLQKAFRKYGEENFIFEILITCHPDTLLWYEQLPNIVITI
jgi:group I intron endonuclease